MTPNALIKINRGTGFFTFGTETTICPLLKVGDGATILTDDVLIGFDESSDEDDHLRRGITPGR